MYQQCIGLQSLLSTEAPLLYILNTPITYSFSLSRPIEEHTSLLLYISGFNSFREAEAGAWCGSCSYHAMPSSNNKHYTRSPASCSAASNMNYSPSIIPASTTNITVEPGDRSGCLDYGGVPIIYYRLSSHVSVSSCRKEGVQGAESRTLKEPRHLRMAK